MNERLQLTLPMKGVENPSNGEAQGSAKVEPPMILKLEQELVAAIEEKNPKWMSLLVQWICIVGAVRHSQLRISFPVKLTGSELHCYCRDSKGGGFNWSCRAHLLSIPVFNWATRFLELWKTVPVFLRENIGMCFHPAT